MHSVNIIQPSSWHKVAFEFTAQLLLFPLFFLSIKKNNKPNLLPPPDTEKQTHTNQTKIYGIIHRRAVAMAQAWAMVKEFNMA